MSDPLRKTKSGELPEVQRLRDKLDSIREHTIPAIEEQARAAEEVRDEIKSMQPAAVKCPVCDGEKVVMLGFGGQVDRFACPACVGLRRDDLTTELHEAAESLCVAEGVPVRWLT